MADISQFPLPFSKTGPGFRLTRAQVPALMTIGGRLGLQKHVAQILAVTTVMGAAPVGEGPPPQWSEPVRRVVLEFLLSVIDDRLQGIYQGYFMSHPAAGNLSQAERIALLDVVRDRAWAVVDQVDWQRMADWLGIADGAAYCRYLLSTLAVPARVVVLRMSYHCNAMCRHCYNESGPERQEPRLPLDRMLDIIAQMPANYVEQLNLTGGEPFLHFEDMLTLIRAGRQAGLKKIALFTNGYWAKTPDIAHHRLDQLQQAGFMAHGGDKIELSTGVAHGEFIDIARIGILIDAYQQLFGTSLVVKCELWGDDHPQDQAFLAALDAAGLTQKVSIKLRVSQTVGRAEGLTAYPPRDVEPCGLGIMAFDPDGTVRPCCGMNYQNDGILISDHRDERLDILIRRMVNDPVMQALNSQRPGALFEQIEGAPGGSGFGGICDWCRHALPPRKNGEALRRQLFNKQRFYPFDFSAS